MLKLSTIFKVLMACALLMGFGLVVIGSDAPVPIQPLVQGDGADFDLKEQLAPVHEDPEEYDPNPSAEEIEAKRDLSVARGTFSPKSITNYNAGSGDKAVFFTEDFESYAPSSPSDPYPPAANGWTRLVTIPTKTWFMGTASLGGTQASLCPYSSPGEVQDEWMITPSIDPSGASGALLVDFLYLHDNLNWPFALDLYISTTGVSPGDFTLLWEASAQSHPNMEYFLGTVDLTAYAGAPFYLGWRYQGEDANLGAIDDIVVYDAAPATGRCCFGVDMLECIENTSPECTFVSGNWTEGEDCTNPCLPPAVGRCCYGVDMLECADNTEAACIALSGDWTGGLDCTTPCPATPPNDDPENAIEIFPPTTVTGSTALATLDCPGVLDWNAVWYVVDAPYAENDLYINYCGGAADIYTIGIVVYEEVLPLDCDAYIIATNYAFNDCGDGTTNPDMSWERLPGPARYLIPVLADDGPLKAGMGFSFDITLTETPPLPPGGSCGDPYTLSLGSGDLPHTESGLLTCGLGNIYSESCLGYYDGGEDFIMELTLTEDLALKITLDPLGTTWSGVMIADACGDVDPCIGTASSSSGAAKSIDGLVLTAGTYYIMVDTWPTPDCIPDFTLTFEAPPEPTSGDNCGDPLSVKLPDDMVDGVFDHTSYTCGRVDNYDLTCLGYYDGGEDMIYLLDVGIDTVFNFVLSSASTYKGMSIDDECPDADETCIATATASSGDVEMLNVSLTAGYYYLQIDTWPSPDCIPEFDLTITLGGGPGPEGDNWDDCVELAGEVVDLPFATTGGYTPDGPQGCLYSANRWYCYTPDQTGLGFVRLCGSGFDTKLAVYDGVDPNTAPLLGCNDDAPCAGLKVLQSELLDLPFIKDNVYLIEVGGYSSSTGAGIINIGVDTCTPPDNDMCEGVTPITLIHGATEDLVGDNSCATNQCASFPGPHTWHAFTLPTTMDVTLDYCGQSPAWGNAWLNLAYGCPCDSFTLAGAYDFTSCGDGNVTIVWDDLAAGTYYYPVMKDPGYDAVGPYTLHVVGMAPSLLTANPEAIDFGTQPAGSMGSLPLELGAVGPGDINFSIASDYSKGGQSNNIWHEIGTTPSPKPPYTGPANVPSVDRQGGEDIGTATVVGSLPYSNSGSTSTYADDYDEACPYTGSDAPDVVYAYTPSANITVDISLCVGSTYDTKLFIYENAATPGAPFACNDDECPGYVSALYELALTGGNTYYIVVDGYGGDFGDYTIDINEWEEPVGRCCYGATGTDCQDITASECTALSGSWDGTKNCTENPCPSAFECPPGATTEAEPCGDDINGGCNGGVFEPILCGETKCGTAWADGGSRDTDWYTVEFFVETEVTFTAQSEFYMLMGFVDTSDCGLAAAVDPAGFADPGEIVSVTRTCGPGVYWLFVAHQDFYDYPCGTNTDYWCTLDCPDGPVLWLSADPTSGVVPGGGTLPITVNYDATDLVDGVYNAALKITNDGRSEKIVPCTITIGDVVPPDTLVLDPAIINAMMINEYVDIDGHIYMGDDLGVVSMDMGSMAVGNGRATIPCTAEYLTTSVPGLTDPVMMLTFDLADFTMMYNEGLMWDCDARSYTVTGTDDGSPFSAGDDFTYCGHTSGDLNLDRQVDIADLVFMVEYMFGGGPAPEVLETADINADGAVDIADLVHFVDWMFMGGAPPQHN